MTIKTGSTWSGTFLTLDATGALAEGTPSGTLYVDGVANGASVTITGSNPYKFSVTLPTLTAGQRVDMYITATISGIATAAIVASEQADTALMSEVKTDTAAILTDTGADITAIKAKTDLITTGTAITVVSQVKGSTITVLRGDTLHAQITGLGSLADCVKLWLTVKADESDPDSAALIQIEKTAGLLYINGAAATVPANGSITINDEPTGDITITLAAVELAKLSPGQYHYDIQILRSTGIAVSTLTSDTFIISADYTKATS